MAFLQVADQAEPVTKEVTQGVIRPAGKAVGAAAGELAKDENRAKVGCPAHLVHPHAEG